MSAERRKFLKLAGLTALGLAGSAPARLLGDDSLAGDTLKLIDSVNTSTHTARAPLTASRWAMVINLRKCREAGECTDCIDACHVYHNVPNFPNQKGGFFSPTRQTSLALHARPVDLHCTRIDRSSSSGKK